MRKREIALAIGIGLLAAGGAALVIEDGNVADLGDSPPVAIAGPSQMTYEVAPFDELSTVGPQDVEITYGEALSVRSEGSPQSLSLLEAVVENGRLTIRPKDGFNRGGWRRLEGAKFFVTVPRLDGITLAGSGDIRVDQIEGESFEATVGGPGEIAIAQLQVDQANFVVAGAGNLIAAGTARDTHVTIGGAGEIQGGGLRSETATVSIGGSGDVALTVEDEAKVSITGSGDVDIYGPARCSVTRMGSGDVSCAGGGGDED